MAHPRALALLLAAAAFPITPALAQEAPVAAAPAPVTPPPVVSTTTAPPAAAPAPTAGTPRIVMMPAKEVAQPLPTPDVQPAAQPAPRAARPAARATRAETAPRPAARPAEAAPVAAVAPTPAPAPVETLPEALPADPVAAAPVVDPAATPPADTTAEVVAPAETTGDAPVWPWIVAGLAVIALIGVFFARRRRTVEEDYYEEPVIVEPAYIAPVAVAPVAAAPIVAEAPVVEEVSVANSDAAEVDAIMAGAVPTGDRPWIELGMRPIRAGTNADDAIVEFELTVGNAGTVSAEDVQISTWMFTADPAQSDNERTMITPPADSKLTELTIEPGDGKRVDAAIALPKSGVHVVSSEGHAAFLPVVGAEARYRLPGGGEGRIAASFAIGMPQGEGEDLAPFHMDGAPDMEENVEARLYGDLERV